MVGFPDFLLLASLVKELRIVFVLSILPFYDILSPLSESILTLDYILGSKSSLLHILELLGRL